jgi:serine phosphatase RsbU (regulator of sigma subunit)
VELSSQDIERGAPLKGEWEFYWKELLTPQDFNTNVQNLTPYYAIQPTIWNKYKIDGEELGSEGFATYRLIIELETDTDLLALEVPSAYNSYKMWVNGVLFCENGKVGISKETSIPQWLPLTKAFHLDEKKIEIIMQVSNFRHVKGGISHATKLGTYKNLSTSREFSIAVDLMVFGCLLLFGFFFLGMYLFWKNDKSLLFFSLFCIVISYRFIGSGYNLIINIFPNASWEFVTKIEYIVLYGGVLLALTFIVELFPKASHPFIVKTFQYLSFFLIAFTLLFPASMYSRLIVPYQFVLLLGLVYTGFVCIKAQQQHYTGAIFAVISIILLLIVGAIASLAYLKFIPHFPFLFEIGFLIYVFSQTFILSFRFSKAFHQVEGLKEETLLQKSNIEEKNGALLQQQEEILAINESMQEKNQHIMDSIRYAETIQSAFLVQEEEMKRLFSDYFVLYKSKDVVSGDFYWLKEIDNKLFFAVADCTGHGVPGAFMSIVGISLLNEIVELRKVHNPTEILDSLHLGIVSSLKQNHSDNKDGMDISLCVFEKNAQNDFEVSFAGAKSPIYYSSSEGLKTISGSRKRVGGVDFRRQDVLYQVHDFIVPKGTTFYLASDGFQDQNNYEGKRFSSSKFHQVLKSFIGKPMNEQQIELETALTKHQGDEKQRDDITVIGLRL